MAPNIWFQIEPMLLIVAFLVLVPEVGIAVAHNAWKGHPAKWDRAMYWTAFVMSGIASLSIAAYAQRVDDGVRTWGHAEQLTLIALAMVLFGVAGGCLLGTFLYDRGRGPIWRKTTPQIQNSTDRIESESDSGRPR